MTNSNRCIAGFDVVEPAPPSKPAPDHRALIDNHEFLTDCARYLEGILNRQQVKKRWRNIDDAVWNLLGDDNELVDAIERTHSLRVQNGSCKRERAQLAVVKAPAILEEILLDTKQSARHRIDSARTLDQFAGNPAEAEQRDVVIIKIDMGSDVRARGGTPGPNDVLVFEATPNPNNTIDHAPQPQQLIQQEPTPPVRRGRGRPPGSKNKPKVTEDSDE